MRWRVDFEFGYASYSDEARARDVYREQGGVRLRRCRDIHDEGVVVEGPPIVVDLTPRTEVN